MAALAYVLLPFSGMIAFFLGGTPRTRFHGIQAVILGVTWPLLLYAASVLSAVATQVTFLLGGIVWIVFLVVAAFGKDPRLPIVGDACARAVRLERT